ncbi:M23 family metallopeptidase [Allostreptomyces psammosilenae]|uniref:Murein DD-endopeptidase MepM/ murein hydrolase activator NlpD n=1 Tax=Allostreptomyces psammosilenae TaxID=1892865 RepID=A0A852ZRT0_9ACTN|nr:M23 family metallopeptidase [Allostreptomyces psammosilenae]NYI05146.1 murein DD-endopeptidase MepM/ murein hydrolase activator NlpD [Allostreptomyces psammosilenae]
MASQVPHARHPEPWLLDESGTYGPHGSHGPGPSGPFGPPGERPAPGGPDSRITLSQSTGASRPARGRHRVRRQRVGRGPSAVLGVAAAAAVGAGGIMSSQAVRADTGAAAEERSIADAAVDRLADLTGAAADEQTAPADGVTAVTTAGEEVADSGQSQTGETTDTAFTDVTDPGELLRARLLAQADQQRADAEEAAKQQAEREAEIEAARIAAERAEAERRAQEEAERREREEAERRAREEAERRAREEAERLANLTVVPTSNYAITSTYGQAGSMWSSGYHTGLDMAAPIGTAVVSAAAGTITSAGWSGAYGYRIVVTHADGTETWYCHLSSIVQASGEVAAGDLIGRVGATGNVSGAHLHLEVRTASGSHVDPLAWLRNRGANV